MNDRTVRSTDPGPSAPLTEGPGAVIAGYRLLRTLGEGGFGVVFEAEQSVPIRRRVALKLIKLGMGSREFVARFEAERQTLAMMDHPHIAKVLDGGASSDGRSYFVMELVEGEAITDYCDRHRLDIDARLRLFVQVCEAVQHAHGKAIIHRDLKPNNVLVSTHDGRPFARVIDFGIAKALGGLGDASAPHTQQHALVGTPAYMSPEQALGSADIDTRSDIYALGVMLYELLTYSTPLEAETLRNAGYYEIQRLIREVEAPRPSDRLGDAHTTLNEAAERFRTEPEQLRDALSGELDWIVMKAISKERELRYATASELAADLNRYLAGEPVLAAPPSRLYRMRKFLRRHAWAASTAALAVLSLLVGVVAFAWQARIAQQRADELARVAGFEQALFGDLDPGRAGVTLSNSVHKRFAAALEELDLDPAERERQQKAFETAWRKVNATDIALDVIDRTLLRPALIGIDSEFESQPRIEAQLRELLADRYASFGMYAAALPLAERALQIRREVQGEDDRETLQSMIAVAYVRRLAGELGAGETLLREALARSREVLGERAPETLEALADLGSVLHDLGQDDEAERSIRAAYQGRREVLGPEHEDTLSSRNDLALLLQAQEEYAEAEQHFRAILALHQRVLGPEHADTLAVASNLASVLQDLERLDEAEQLTREVLDTSRRVLGRRHPDTLISLNNLGVLQMAQGKLDEAERSLRGVVRAQAALGRTHPTVINAISNLAEVLEERGALAEAERYYQQAWERSARAFGAEHRDTLYQALDLARLQNDRHAAQAAESVIAPLLNAFRARFVEYDPAAIGQALTELGRARLALRRHAEAEPLLLEAQALFEANPEGVELVQAKGVRALARLYREWQSLQPSTERAAQAQQWSQREAALAED